MKVLVIGDSCIDEFIYCDIERIFPEAPVPVLKPFKTQQNPGMASNVVANLQSLKADVDLVTNTSKIKKTRYVDARSGQMVMRVDKNDKCKSIQSLSSTGKFATCLSNCLKTLWALSVFNTYVKFLFIISEIGLTLSDEANEILNDALKEKERKEEIKRNQLELSLGANQWNLK